jgi:hypothetical protein
MRSKDQILLEGIYERILLKENSDEEYLRLAENPEENKEELQRMVGDAARAAGYDSPKVYHGSKNVGFTEFERRPRTLDWSVSTRNAFHFTTYKDDAKYYAGEEFDEQGGMGEVREFYLSANLVIYAGNRDVRQFLAANKPILTQDRKTEPAHFDRVSPDTLLVDIEVITDATKDLLLKNGYSGIVYPRSFGSEYAVFSPSQIKSADPVSYDKGNIIPLSQRFDSSNNDIRY